MNNDHQLCCFLKLTRLMKREAQKKIAYSTGIDISLISRFEKGKRVPTDKQTQKLLAFYGTDTETFFREDENVENILNNLFEAIYYVKDYDREQIVLRSLIRSIKHIIILIIAFFAFAITQVKGK